MEESILRPFKSGFQGRNMKIRDEDGDERYNGAGGRDSQEGRWVRKSVVMKGRRT